MVSLFTLQVLLLLLCLCLSTSFANDNDIDQDTIIQNLVEWVRSKPGGFVSPKLDIRRMNVSESTSPYGVFVKDDYDVEEDEILLQVPPECYIQIAADQVEALVDEEGNYDTDPNAIMGAYYRNVCRLAKRLYTEMTLSTTESTFFASSSPYVAYLKTQRAGQIPATWSREGKELFRQVVGNDEHGIPPGLNGIDWIKTHILGNGCSIMENDDKDHGSDAFAEHVVAMAVQRGYDTALIPLWDMVNHDNSMRNNNLKTNSLYSNEGIQVSASKAIGKNQELFASYNYCVDCHDIGNDWGTAGILRDFGFVESYPHVWHFEAQDIWYKVDNDDDAHPKTNVDETGSISTTDDHLRVSFWEEDGIIYVPNQEQLAFLQEQYQRLEGIVMEHSVLLENEATAAGVPPHEWMTISTFARVAATDMALAIEETMKRHKKNGNDDNNGNDEL